MSNRSLQQRARRHAHAYLVWILAQIECDVAFMKWRTAGSEGAALAHGEYVAALDREESAAGHLEALSTRARPLTARVAR
jgi:hypothetical protein